MSRTLVIVCLAASAVSAGPVVRAFAGAPVARGASRCSTSAPQIDARKVLPAGFPLPAGVTFTWIERNGAETTLVGMSPRALPATARFFRTALARIGTRSTWTDAEFGEAEARFSGPALAGKWRVNAVPSCAGASVVTLSFPSRVDPSVAAS